MVPKDCKGSIVPQFNMGKCFLSREAPVVLPDVLDVLKEIPVVLDEV